MSKLYSNSLLILGLIEDIEINNIRTAQVNIRDTHDDELLKSIQEKGLLQPIIVRPVGNYYDIVAGTRRYNVCRRLGWKKVICHIVEVSDKEAFEISLIENIQRKNLDPIEEANAFKKYVLNFGWGGVSELATKIGKSIAYVDRRLKLLELPPDIINSVTMSKLSPSSAEELIPIKDNDELTRLADLIMKKKIPSRKVRDMVKEIRNQNSVYCDELSSNCEPYYSKTLDEKSKKVFDKSITILKITTQKLAMLISEVEDNWITYELMMQHKCMIDKQIDIIVKQKKKFNY